MNRKFALALLFSLCLLLTACTADGGGTSFFQTLAQKLTDMAGDIAVRISVEGLEDSNAAFEEPATVRHTVSRYRYEQLNDTAKLAYRCIYNKIFSHPERISIPRLSDEEFSDVFTALRYDNPQLLCLADNASILTAGVKCYFIPNYARGYWECQTLSEQTLEAAGQLLAGISADATEYERILYAHDRLCESCSYGEAPGSAESCGALLENTAVCSGYSKALKLLLDMLGITSCVVTGTVNDNGVEGVSHMWLTVRVDDKWYHCDPTWDDPVSRSGAESVDHAYFCVPEDVIARTHADRMLPAGIVCDSTDASYYVREKLLCTAENYREIIAAALLRAIQAGKPGAEFLFDSAATMSAATEVLLGDGAVYEMLDAAAVYNRALSASRVNYTASETTLLFKIYFVFE